MESPSPSPLPCCAPTPFFQYECWLTAFGNLFFTYAQMLSVGQKSQRRPGACEGGSESVCFQIVKDFKIRKKMEIFYNFTYWCFLRMDSCAVVFGSKTLMRGGSRRKDALIAAEGGNLKW